MFVCFSFARNVIVQGSVDQSDWTTLVVTELPKPSSHCNLQLHEFQVDEEKVEGWYRYLKIIFVDHYKRRAGLHYFDIEMRGLDDF